MSEKKKPLSEEDKQICANLYRIWAAKKKELGITQQMVADALKITQGGVSHQLKGRNALTTDAIIIWAEMLKCKETDIDPNRKYAASVDPKLTGGRGKIFERLESEDEDYIRELIDYVDFLDQKKARRNDP